MSKLLDLADQSNLSQPSLAVVTDHRRQQAKRILKSERLFHPFPLSLARSGYYIQVLGDRVFTDFVASSCYYVNNVLECVVLWGYCFIRQGCDGRGYISLAIKYKII